MKRFHLVLLASLCLSAIPSAVFAFACQTKNGGNWSDKTIWQNCKGTIPQAGDDVTINNVVVQDVNSNNINSLTINSSGELDQGLYNSTVTLTVSGNVTNNGKYYQYQGGNSTNNIGGNLVNNGNGIIDPSSAQAVFNVAGSFTNNGTFNFQNGTGSLTVTGSLVNNGGATIDFSNGAANIFLGGNYTNGGTFAPGTGTFTLNGTTAQAINNALSVPNLVVNNAGSGVTLAANLTVTGSLTLTDGVVTTGGNALIYSPTCSAGNPAGNSASFVYGNVTLTFPWGAATCTFPVGSGTNLYAPITVAFTTSLGGTLTGTTQPDTGGAKEIAAGFNTTTSVSRYWTLTRGSILFLGSYSATLQFNNPADLGASAVPGNFVVATYTGGSWTSPTVGTRTSTTTQATGITGFGDFVVGTTTAAALTCVSPLADPQPDGSHFAANWFTRVITGSFTPSLVDSGGNPCSGSSCRLRLTDANTTEATQVTYIKQGFPFGVNKITASFDYWSYGGTGADGIAFVFSDPNNPSGNSRPTAGAFGGSLGYAQKSNPGSDCTTPGGCPGFTGGWVGLGLDEYGNYANPTEGRIGGTGYQTSSVAIRGASSNYAFLAGNNQWNRTASGNSSQNYRYLVTLDSTASNGANATVTVQRDTSGTGNSYQTQLTYTAAAPPAQLQLSFTGSTGGATNIHEIANLQVCYLISSNLPPPPGAAAANFNAVDGSLGSYPATVSAQRIYTKLASAPFTLNVAALNNATPPGLLSPAYVSGTNKVKVDVVDDSDGACLSSCAGAACQGKTAVATQTTSFVSNDNSYKQVSFTVANAYSNLRARIADTSNSPTVYGCSTDNFAVRPYQLAISSAGANADPAGTSTTSTPTIVAGANFTLTVTAQDTSGNMLSGWNTAPAVNGSSVQAHSGAIQNGTLSGSFPAPTNGQATGTFTYSEVGYFRLVADGIYDNSFTAVDTGSSDCTADYSNTLVGGKYGCWFGNPVTSYFGRFIPNNFVMSSAGITPADSGGGYSYMDQPFNIGFTLTAVNSSGAATQDYAPLPAPSTSSFANLVPATAAWLSTALGTNSSFGLGARNGTADLSGRLVLNGTPSGTWSSGVAAITAGLKFSRPTTMTADVTWGPFDSLDVGVAPQDADGVTLLSGALNLDANNDGVNERQKMATNDPTKIRFGRLRLLNAYGSELLPILVPVRAEYWNGTGWVLHANDSTTTFTPATVVSLGNCSGPLSASQCTGGVPNGGTISISTTSQHLVNGQTAITLTRPNCPTGTCPTGALDMTMALGAGGTTNDCVGLGNAAGGTGTSWLRGYWGAQASCNNAAPYVQDPNARATFGTAKSRYIYLRERY